MSLELYALIGIALMVLGIIGNARAQRPRFDTPEAKQRARDYADATAGIGWHERRRRGW